MKQEKKLKALVIYPIPNSNNKTEKWGIVNMTELMEDEEWICGLNLITSIEDVVEKADKENVPIITIKYLETKIKIKKKL